MGWNEFLSVSTAVGPTGAVLLYMITNARRAPEGDKLDLRAEFVELRGTCTKLLERMAAVEAILEERK